MKLEETRGKNHTDGMLLVLLSPLRIEMVSTVVFSVDAPAADTAVTVLSLLDHDLSSDRPEEINGCMNGKIIMILIRMLGMLMGR